MVNYEKKNYIKYHIWFNAVVQNFWIYYYYKYLSNIMLIVRFFWVFDIEIKYYFVIKNFFWSIFFKKKIKFNYVLFFLGGFCYVIIFFNTKNIFIAIFPDFCFYFFFVFSKFFPISQWYSSFLLYLASRRPRPPLRQSWPHQLLYPIVGKHCATVCPMLVQNWFWHTQCTSKIVQHTPNTCPLRVQRWTNWRICWKNTASICTKSVQIFVVLARNLSRSMLKKAPIPPVFDDFDVRIAVARSRNANFLVILCSRSFAPPRSSDPPLRAFEATKLRKNAVFHAIPSRQIFSYRASVLSNISAVEHQLQNFR